MVITTHLRNHTHQTVTKIVIYTQKQYNILYSLLHRLGFTYKKTRSHFIAHEYSLSLRANLLIIAKQSR